MHLSRSYWLLWTGQILNRIGVLSPAFLVIYMQDQNILSSDKTAIFIGLFAAGVLLAGLIGGVVADVFGARRVILLAQPVAIITALLYLVAHDLSFIGILAFMTGFLSTVDRPAGAGLISHLVPQEQFSRAYSLYLMGFNVGMTLSPVLAGLLLGVFPQGIFVVWAASSVCYGFLARALPADSPIHIGNRAAMSPRNLARGLIAPYRSRVIMLFLVLCFLVAAIYLQVNSSLALNMRAEGLVPTQIGIVLAVNAILSIVLLPFVPKLVGRWPDQAPLALAALLLGVGFGLNAFAHDMAMFGVALVVWTFGEVLWAPMAATFLAKRAPEGQMSSYQGSFFFAWNAAFIVGGPIGIVVADAFGYATLWFATLIIGIAAALGFMLLARVPGFSLTHIPQDQRSRDTEGAYEAK